MAQDPHIRPDGIWDDNWYQQQQKGGGSGGGGGFPTFDPMAVAQKMMEMQKAANAPVIASYREQIPETQAKFEKIATGLEARQAPLAQRYDALLKSVVSRGGETLQQTAINTAREFGRRGISTLSGIAEQTQAERARPIREQISSQEMQLGSERENALQNLVDAITQTRTGGIDAVRQIQNAIAALEGGSSSAAISSLPDLYSAAQSAAEKAWAAAQPTVTPMDNYETELNGQRVLMDRNTGKVISVLGPVKTSGGSNVDNELTDWMDKAKSRYTDYVMSTFGENTAIQQGLIGPRTYVGGGGQ